VGPQQALRRIEAMRAFLPLVLSALALACTGAQAQAVADVPPPPRLQEAAPAPAAAPGTPVAARSPARAASGVPSNVRVIEDDEVRIEEARGQRGQLQRITVRSKTAGTRPYEIIVGPGGQDPSQARGATGQRAWSLFDF
jgi:hypothetical protein